MGVEIRQFDRVKEKVEIRLDSRQIGWLVIGCSAIAAGVFAAGYVVGETNGPGAPMPEQTALVAGPVVADKAKADEVEVASGEAPVEAPMHYTYDRVLTDKTPPTKLDDPVIEAKAQEAKRREIEARAARAEAAAEAGGETGEAAAETEDKAAVPAEPAAADEANEEPSDEELPKAAPVQRPTAAVAPAAAPNAAAASSGSGKPSYTIQVKAFRKRKEARQFLNALREAGYHPFMVMADIPGKGRFYRVRVGKFDSLEEAEKVQAAFEKAEGFKTFLQTQ